MNKQSTFTQAELNDMSTWVYGINPNTTSETFDAMIKGFEDKFAITGNIMLQKMADEYKEARKAYGK